MNIVDLDKKDEMAGQIAELERNMGKYQQMVRLTAEITYAKYQAYIDSGFSEDQALLLIQAGV